MLEEDESFDAGKGAVLTSAGKVELDAIIMEGKELRAGAVAAIGPVLHPISVSRMVMEKTPHVLLVGEGATSFARENGIPILAEDDLVWPPLSLARLSSTNDRMRMPLLLRMDMLHCALHVPPLLYTRHDKLGHLAKLVMHPSLSRD